MTKFLGIYGLYKYRELLTELVKREIKARYKQSVLGYAWVLIVPLLNLVVLTIVFSFFIKIPTGGVPYYIFLFIALVPWNFTANSITQSTSSLVVNSTLITKIKLPRELFPLASVISKMVDLFFATIVLVIFLLISGTSIEWTILFVPLIFIIQLFLVVGLSFILSALNVFYRDVENVIAVMLMIWMYLTPVLYPQELVPAKLIPIYNLNPMTPIINSYRNTILYGVLPPMPSLAYAAVASVVIFFIGYKFFRNRSKYFADVV